MPAANDDDRIGLRHVTILAAPTPPYPSLPFADHVIINPEFDNMIRTQVSLGENEYHLAKREAKALGIPVAELVRRALRQSIAIEAQNSTQAPWMRYAGLVETGDAHSGQRIDDLIYGHKD